MGQMIGHMLPSVRCVSVLCSAVLYITWEVLQNWRKHINDETSKFSRNDRHRWPSQPCHPEISNQSKLKFVKILLKLQFHRRASKGNQICSPTVKSNYAKMKLVGVRCSNAQEFSISSKLGSLSIIKVQVHIYPWSCSYPSGIQVEVRIDRSGSSSYRSFRFNFVSIPWHVVRIDQRKSASYRSHGT
jgi:hypothetical protein